MPSPTTVWLVSPGGEGADRGTLSLEGGVLRFTADEGERVSMASVERARRLRGTPVLEVVYEVRGERRVALLYFVEPPPVPRRMWIPSPIGVVGAKGRLRSSAILRLRSANRALKPVIEEWARAIRG